MLEGIGCGLSLGVGGMGWVEGGSCYVAELGGWVGRMFAVEASSNAVEVVSGIVAMRIFG